MSSTTAVKADSLLTAALEVDPNHPAALTYQAFSASTARTSRRYRARPSPFDALAGATGGPRRHHRPARAADELG
ncbi:MAG: hypothetical protein R2695_04835 [Acidimicrobiales bacterium]